MKHYTVSDFSHVTPIYTGGNIYVFFGQTQDGAFFIADGDMFDVRILSDDPSAAGDDAWYPDWQEAHLLRDIKDDEERLSFITAMIGWVLEKGDGCYIGSDLEAIKEEAESLKGTTGWR